MTNTTASTNLPSISCCMPTYGRSVELLNEAVQCFLDQDYKGDKELVIYNDYKNVQFAFDHPEVRIVNSSEREPTLGAKYNATVALARHDYICLWDDDDIYLPHRLSYSIANLKNDVFRSGRNYLLRGKNDHVELMSSVFPATVCIKKSLYDAIGGFKQGSWLSTRASSRKWPRYSTTTRSFRSRIFSTSTGGTLARSITIPSSLAMREAMNWYRV
jgi:glycosyltransferase involved in cell wall biosynthesis